MIKMKHNTLALIGLSVLFFVACGGEKSSSVSSSDKVVASAETTKSSGNSKGKLIYKQYCVVCHGMDGKLAVSGAKDLSVSVLPIEERIDQITNGKGLMTPYKDILSTEQIQAVAEYLDELRK